MARAGDLQTNKVSWFLYLSKRVGLIVSRHLKQPAMLISVCTVWASFWPAPEATAPRPPTLNTQSYLHESAYVYA